MTKTLAQAPINHSNSSITGVELHNLIQNEVKSAVASLPQPAKGRGEFQTELEAELRGFTDDQARHGTGAAIYGTTNNDLAPNRMAFAIGQNEYATWAQLAGVTTDYAEVYLPIQREAGRFYASRIFIADAPEGTIFTFDGTKVFIKQNNTVSELSNFSPDKYSGELVQLGGIDLRRLPKHLKKKFEFEDALIDLDKKENDPNVSPEEKARLGQFAKREGHFYVYSIESGSLRPCMDGDYVVKYKKDFSGRFLDKEGKPIFLNNDGERVDENDPSGSAYFRLSREIGNEPDGAGNFSRKVSYKLISSSGTKPIKDPDLFQVLEEGIYSGGTSLVDARKQLIDHARPGQGLYFDNHFCRNTGKVVTFKKKTIGYNMPMDYFGKDMVLPKDAGFPDEKYWKKNKKGEIEYEEGYRDLVNNVTITVEKYEEISKAPDFRKSNYQKIAQLDKDGNKIPKIATGYQKIDGKDVLVVMKRIPDYKNREGFVLIEYIAYDLEKENKLPIMEFASPSIGQDGAFYQWGRSSRKVFQHEMRFFQSVGQNQSDGVSVVAEGGFWHGRLLDRVTTRFMERYLSQLGPITKNDFTPDGPANTLLRAQALGEDRTWFQWFLEFYGMKEAYLACRETGQQSFQSSRASFGTDNLDTLKWEYALARSVADVSLGLQRIGVGVNDFSKVSAVTATMTFALSAAAGLAALPAGVAAATVGMVFGAIYYGSQTQFDRRRRDLVSQEEIDRKADTWTIFGKLEKIEGEKKSYKEVRERVLRSEKNGEKGQYVTWSNFGGLNNDILCVGRGLAGIAHILSGGMPAEAKHNSAGWNYTMWALASTAIAAGSVTLNAIGAETLLASSAMSTNAMMSGITYAAASFAAMPMLPLAVASVATVAAIGLGSVAASRFFLASTCRKAKNYVNDMREDIDFFKDNHLNVYDEKMLNSKDVRVRPGIKRRKASEDLQYSLSP